MIVNSHNDWDPLEEIIVGRADHSRIATDISARSFSYANFDKAEVEKLDGYINKHIRTRGPNKYQINPFQSCK